MNELELKQAIKNIEIQQQELATRKGQLQDDLAQLLCCFKVGDVGVITGYNHKGKRCQITSIKLGYGYVKLSVQLFKKDGTLGVFEAKIYQDYFEKDGE